MPAVPFLTFFVFLGLKLSDGIDWSWWWVTSPLWIVAVLGVVFMVLGLSFIGCAAKALK